MTETLYSSGMLNSSAGLVLAGLIGFFFGNFLEKAGFGSSRKLTGIFYLRDMSVLKVMFSAVVTALVGYHYFVALGWISPQNVYPLETYWAAQIVGGLVFGLGFVIGGWCPGTAFVGLASAKWDALVFLAGAGIGSIVFNESFGLVRGLHTGTHAGIRYLPESLGIASNWFPLVFCIIAVAAFSLSSMAEKKFGKKADEELGSRPAHMALAALLLLLAAGIGFLPEQAPAEPPAATGVPTTLGAIADAEDHIEPEDVAEQLMGPAHDLFLVDIRDPDDYAKFHIRGAINIPMREIEARTGELPSDRRVVLYSNGTTHAAQAWLQLYNMGHNNLLVLTDGILGFWKRCLTPPSLSSVVDPGAAHAALPGYLARRAYFVEGEAPTPPEQAAGPADAAPMTAPGLKKHLVSTDWLAKRLDDRKIKVIDVGNKSSRYSTAHIPGALYLNMENLRTTLGGYHSMLAPAEDIASTLGRLGITPSDTVIVYDDRLRDATLMAVALDRVGHKSYAILHGGFGKWKDEGRRVTPEVPKVSPAEYKAAPGSDNFTIDLDGTEAARKQGKTLIIDGRPADYYTGKKSDEARPGHIPGAVSSPYKNDLVPGKALWKSLPALKSHYEGIGVDAKRPVIVHCRTGHQASQTYFLLKHLMGMKDVKWLDASWMAWAARPDLPVEK